MNKFLTRFSCTAFSGVEVVASGSLQHVVSTVKDALDDKEFVQLLIFDDSTGKPIDIDFRGKTDDVLKRLEEQFGDSFGTEVNDQTTRRVGRPKLGVVSGEVTLLPRHWEWLKSQPGGASVTLRKLIDEARRAGEQQSTIRKSQEAAYSFMTAMAGDFHQYEEALRALYAGDFDRFYRLIEDWAPGIRNYVKRLAANAFPDELESIRYLEPTQLAGMRFMQRGIEGSIVMLNLLRFRDVADYSANPQLAPEVPISGAEAFNRYIEHTLPFLRDSGGEIVFLGDGGEFLIGPEDEKWDLVMLIRQSSAQSFLAFSSHQDYLAGIGHRTAAIENSRLLPTVELPKPK